MKYEVVLKQHFDNGDWVVTYVDGGVRASFNESELSAYRDDEVCWNMDDTFWSRADNLVSTGPTLEVYRDATVRVPSECRKQGGVKTYRIQDDTELTKKMMESAMKAMKPLTVLTEGGCDWSPELGKGSGVVEE